MQYKILLFLSLRSGSAVPFAKELKALTRDLLGRLPEGSGCAAAMLAKAEVPPHFSAARGRACDASIELKPKGDCAPGRLAHTCNGLGKRLKSWVHTDLSAALIGTERVFLPSAPMPLRLQYLMRRRADFSHAAYLERYEKIHSEFGLRTSEIKGYVQFHADPALCEQAAAVAGFGVWGIDSVSELHIPSLSAFLKAAETENTGREAIADEEHFVDRANSTMFISDEIFRLSQ